MHGCLDYGRNLQRDLPRPSHRLTGVVEQRVEARRHREAHNVDAMDKAETRKLLDRFFLLCAAVAVAVLGVAAF